MAARKRKNYTAAICKDCNTEVFADVNMVMLKDALWKKICDKQADILCDVCMEKRLHRPITPSDFLTKDNGGMILCNRYWMMQKKKQ